MADDYALPEELAFAVLAAIQDPDTGPAAALALRVLMHRTGPHPGEPVDLVQWVPVDLVEPNAYNPNSVARREMALLHTSIAHDGYTQPVVTVFDRERGRYIIVDGFHRYFVAKTYQDIRERTGGRVPVVVIEKGMNDRMASTVRHNRARGKHSVTGMAQMVFRMLDNGWQDADICNELGMEPEEILRLKHVTGFSKLFEDVEYSRAWLSRAQARLEAEARQRGDLPPRTARDSETAGPPTEDPADRPKGGKATRKAKARGSRAPSSP